MMVQNREVISTTRWVDNKAAELDEVIDKILGKNGENLNSRTLTYREWNLVKKFDENQELQFNSKKLIYNMIIFSCLQGQEGSEESDMGIKSGYIVVYQFDNRIYYLINKNSDALKILRLLMGYNGQNEITRKVFGLDADFFVWVLKRFYDDENLIAADNDQVSDVVIKSVKGFKGDTGDWATKIHADGESVMKLISTLSFLLENKKIYQIRIELEYKEHNNIELYLTVKKNETIMSQIEKYAGCLETENISKEELEANLYLLIYLEIIPILHQAYLNDIDNNDWNKEVHIKFLNTIGSEVSERVNKLIKDL